MRPSSPFTLTHACALALALTLPGLGCKSGEDAPSADKPSGERTEEPEPETPKDAPTGPFAAFDFDAAKQRWQGAWVVRDEAWLIEGDSITVVKGGEEKKLAFSIYSPCQIAMTNEAAGETSYRPFAIKGDAIHVSLGSAAGVVVGEQSIVCASGRVYTLEGDTCTEWSEMFDDWKDKPGECGYEGEGEERRFVVGSSKLRAVDGALLSENLEKSVAASHPSLDAAKAALAGTP